MSKIFLEYSQEYAEATLLVFIIINLKKKLLNVFALLTNVVLYTFYYKTDIHLTNKYKLYTKLIIFQSVVL